MGISSLHRQPKKKSKKLPLEMPEANGYNLVIGLIFPQKWDKSQKA
jgi:hypothetical protein